MLLIMRLPKIIYSHGKDVLFNGKKQQDYEQGICIDGRYYFHQILDLGEEKGCALTCLAMLFSNYKKKKITPVQVYRWNMNSYRVYWDVVFLRAQLQWNETSVQYQTDEEKLRTIKNLLAQHPEGVVGQFRDERQEVGGLHYVLLEKVEQLNAEGVVCADPMGRGDAHRGELPLTETYAWSKYGREKTLTHLERIIFVRHTSNKIIAKQFIKKKLRFLKYCLPLVARNKFLIYKYTNHWPDTKQPVTFIDKLLVYMWSDKMEEYSRFADKIAVREYVRNTVGEQYLTKFYGRYTSLQQVDFAKLPAKFYVKANHGCGWNLPGENKEEFCQHLAQNEQQIQSWLKDNLWNRNGERQYKNIKPAIFIEEYLPLFWPRDTMLRVFCFGGKPAFINISRGFAGEEMGGVNLWYDTAWQPQPCLMNYPGVECQVDKPANLQEILSVATKLATPFPFVRVDLYNLGGKRVVFSEVTLTPSADRAIIHSPAWDKKLGDMFPLA